ncbi:hypothetical protein EX30DRAFT_342663 [Ascodesmis nigricans]|uniref:Uncharacterized protein n=1 Tax=Ascodesmis nigricans TaxID=341454 RepID=A0A4S2MPW4_9PEZI|nr:hypothetical protein EX30DRAFT_342663 [Ascodesmis nigricans]
MYRYSASVTALFYASRCAGDKNPMPLLVDWKVASLGNISACWLQAGGVSCGGLQSLSMLSETWALQLHGNGPCGPSAAAAGFARAKSRLALVQRPHTYIHLLVKDTDE